MQQNLCKISCYKKYFFAYMYNTPKNKKEKQENINKK